MKKIYINDLFGGAITSNAQIGQIIQNEKVNAEKNLVQWQKQEGDIPSLYTFTYDGLKFEISALNNIILGFSLKFADNANKSFWINVRNDEVHISQDTSIFTLLLFLNIASLDWEFNKLESDAKTLAINIANKCKFVYYFNSHFFGLYQIACFDWQLYEKLSKEVKQNR